MNAQVRHLPTDFAGWLARVDATGPMAPGWFRSMMAQALADARMDADSLLALADATVEAAVESGRVGWRSLERDLRALSDLPRMLAPHRVAPVACDFQ